MRWFFPTLKGAFLIIPPSHIFRNPKIYSSLQICRIPGATIYPCSLSSTSCLCYYTCKNNPLCNHQEEECPKICTLDCAPWCAGFIRKQCLWGLSCFEAPNDGCDPARGGVDCIGVCLPADLLDQLLKQSCSLL